jgi:uncharacterized coiled-coil protein SlyX
LVWVENIKGKKPISNDYKETDWKKSIDLERVRLKALEEFKATQHKKIDGLHKLAHKLAAKEKKQNSKLPDEPNVNQAQSSAAPADPMFDKMRSDSDQIDTTKFSPAQKAEFDKARDEALSKIHKAEDGYKEARSASCSSLSEIVDFHPLFLGENNGGSLSCDDDVGVEDTLRQQKIKWLGVELNLIKQGLNDRKYFSNSLGEREKNKLFSICEENNDCSNFRDLIRKNLPKQSNLSSVNFSANGETPKDVPLPQEIATAYLSARRCSQQILAWANSDIMKKIGNIKNLDIKNGVSSHQIYDLAIRVLNPLDNANEINLVAEQMEKMLDKIQSHNPQVKDKAIDNVKRAAQSVKKDKAQQLNPEN